MVVGGQKEKYIKQHKILELYQQEFVNYLSKQDTTLFTVGYSFGDEHINKTIIKAARDSGIKAFIIDPKGVDVLKTHIKSEAIRNKEPIETEVEPIVIGASRRSLIEIFDGQENGEYQKILKVMRRGYL